MVAGEDGALGDDSAEGLDDEPPSKRSRLASAKDVATVLEEDGEEEERLQEDEESEEEEARERDEVVHPQPELVTKDA